MVVVRRQTQFVVWSIDHLLIVMRIRVALCVCACVRMCVYTDIWLLFAG